MRLLLVTWERAQKVLGRALLQPVCHPVFYTDSRPWEFHLALVQDCRLRPQKSLGKWGVCGACFPEELVLPQNL